MCLKYFIITISDEYGNVGEPFESGVSSPQAMDISVLSTPAIENNERLDEQNVINEGDEVIKPPVPVMSSGIAKVPAAAIVKEEDASNITSGAEADESSIGSSKDASTSWSDLNSPEDRTEDLLRLYGRPSSNNEAVSSLTKVAKELNFY